MKQNIFNGHASENPMDHMQQLEDLCCTTKANGVPEDYLKLILFKFTLGDKASKWLRLLASEMQVPTKLPRRSSGGISSSITSY